VSLIAFSIASAWLKYTFDSIGNLTSTTNMTKKKFSTAETKSFTSARNYTDANSTIMLTKLTSPLWRNSTKLIGNLTSTTTNSSSIWPTDSTTTALISSSHLSTRNFTVASANLSDVFPAETDSSSPTAHSPSASLWNDPYDILDTPATIWILIGSSVALTVFAAMALSVKFAQLRKRQEYRRV